MKGSFRRFAILSPGIGFIVASCILPIIWLLNISVTAQTGGDFTTDNYTTVLADAFYWRVAANTIVLSSVVALLSVLFAYPIALYLSRTRSRWRGFLTALAIAPLLTSTVIRTYGWMVILGDQGLVNGVLMGMGLIDRPFRLSNNYLGAGIAMTEILMPFAILVIMGGLGRLRPDVEEAAAVHGASARQVFLKVILPLSMPAMATAAILVFALAISSFVTPRLMGGGRVFVLGTEIYTEAAITLNWPLAATLSVLLLGLFVIFMVGYAAINRSRNPAHE
jgi:putative spermidine/putrescine transport system permease protein